MTNPRSLSERLREEARYWLTGGTESKRVGASLNEAAAALDSLHAENAKLKADLATFGKDTEAAENKIIDAEFANTELLHLLAEAEGALEEILACCHEYPSDEDEWNKGIDSARVTIAKLKALYKPPATPTTKES